MVNRVCLCDFSVVPELITFSHGPLSLQPPAETEDDLWIQIGGFAVTLPINQAIPVSEPVRADRA